MHVHVLYYIHKGSPDKVDVIESAMQLSYGSTVTLNESVLLQLLSPDTSIVSAAVASKVRAQLG